MPKVAGTQLTSSPQASAAQSIGGPGPLRNALPESSFGVAPIGGQEVNRGITNLGQGISQAAKSLIALDKRINTTDAEAELVDFERAKNDMLFNPESGFMNSRGRDSFEGSTAFNEQILELQKSHSENLSPAARGMFVQASDSVVTRVNSDVMRHASTQFDAYETATLNSRAENSIENAALYWNDPDQLAISLEVGRQSVMDMAQISGVGAETLAEDLQTFNSAFAVQSVEGAIVESASAAQEALANSRNLLEGPDIAQLQTKIDKKFKIEKNQNDANSAVIVASELVSEHGDAPNARTLITEQVGLIDDPELRSRTLRESMFHLNAKLQGDSERRGKSFEAGEEFMLSGGSLQAFIAENPSAWDDLTARQKRSLSSGSSVVTDYAKLSELLLLPTAELAKVNPTDHYDFLSPGDRNRLNNEVRAARTGDGEGQAGRSRTAQTTTSVNSLFGTPAKRNKEQNNRADAFYSALTAEENKRISAKGAPLSSREYSELLNEMTGSAVINRDFWFDTSGDLSDIPGPDTAAITAEIHRLGGAATAENIIRVYNDPKYTRAQ